jgi:uncharacterized protein (TIGR02145 family)
MVTIGEQVWMAENLNYESTSGSYCYGGNSTNCDTYGRLYTWAAAMGGAASSSTTPSGVQGVCPVGWHLPSDAEWTILSDYVIANSAGTSTDDIGPFLKSTTGWDTYSGITSDDAYGFSGLPGGYRVYNVGSLDVGLTGYWWSSTERHSSYAYRRNLYYGHDYFSRDYYDKSYAISVRCLANASPTVSISQVSPKYPVVGEPVSFTADTTGIYNESSAPVVTWSLNGGAFGSDGIDFTYVPTEAGRDTVIAKVEQNGVSSFDTVYVVYVGILTDVRDNQEYPFVTIGTQTWMAENLNYESTSGSYCYGDNSTNCDTYGRLYTWAAAMGGAASSSTTPSGVQGVCPVGWHLPSDAEWEALSDYVIANSAGTSTYDIGPFLKANSGWADNGNGTDDFGFSGLPGGYRYSNGSYVTVGDRGVWWSSTEINSLYAYRRCLNYNGDTFVQSHDNKPYAYSVRCLQDPPEGGLP